MSEELPVHPWCQKCGSYLIDGKCETGSARIDERYIREKIEAYDVAISALMLHESADPQPDRLDSILRKRLAAKLDREIQRWVNSLPNDQAH